MKCSGLFLAVVLETSFQNVSLSYVGVEVFPDLVFGNICGGLSVEKLPWKRDMCCHESLLLRKRTVDDDFGVSSWAPPG